MGVHVHWRHQTKTTRMAQTQRLHPSGEFFLEKVVVLNLDGLVRLAKTPVSRDIQVKMSGFPTQHPL